MAKNRSGRRKRYRICRVQVMVELDQAGSPLRVDNVYMDGRNIRPRKVGEASRHWPISTSHKNVCMVAVSETLPD